MKFLFKIGFGFLLLISTNTFAQLPSNIGFEKGTFDGWECSVGKRDEMTGIDLMGSPGSPVYNKHTILDTSYRNTLDTYGGFPMLCPNGSNYSIKLGNDMPAGNMQRVTYTFTVPANVSSYSIVFNYAVVLENPTHKVDEQPLFTARVYDVSDDTYVTCPSFDFAASASLPGFIKSDVTRVPAMPNQAPAPVFYKDWSTAMIDLKSYAGKTVRLEFTAEDCRLGGHFGYAYLDVDEQLSLKPINGNVFCINQNTVTLNGPTGFADYIWTRDNDLTHTATHGQSFTVPAVDKEKYTLEVIPYPGGGNCTDFLYVTLQKLTEPFKLVVAPQVYGCPGIGVNLKAATVTAGSSSSMTFSYYKDAAGLTYLPNPNAVVTAGTYYIRGTNLGGCTDISPVEVIISNPDITVLDPNPVQYPLKVDLATTHTTQAGVSYLYYSDAAGKIAVDSKVNVSGTYYIKATSGTPCSVIVPVKVVVNPPPPYTIVAPNTFTPNGDGINDNFKIKIDGYVNFGTVNIFNRYGQKVYTTKAEGDYWTGTMNNQQLPAGTYYWIFEGTDQYTHVKVTKAASITIIR